jgi:hypothetical protein
VRNVVAALAGGDSGRHPIGSIRQEALHLRNTEEQKQGHRRNTAETQEENRIRATAESGPQQKQDQSRGRNTASKTRPRMASPPWAPADIGCFFVFLLWPQKEPG